MKVYVVKAPQGEYEDYQEPIVKVFLDKKKAKNKQDIILMKITYMNVGSVLVK